MILSVGEILADMYIRGEDISMRCGGAPFNVAVACKRHGCASGFIGRAGNDPIGNFLRKEAEKYALDYLDVQRDNVRNTTLALVGLSQDGERSFSFFRSHTADYFIDLSKIDFSEFSDLGYVNIGSLLFSKEEGRSFASAAIKKLKSLGIKICVDVNFRSSLYSSVGEMIRVYKSFVDSADIVKFSSDELMLYCGERDIARASSAVGREDKLVLVSAGADGSYCRYKDIFVFSRGKKVRPVDTTGAGDAFFGTALSCLDGKNLDILSEKDFKNTLEEANKAGAAATLRVGAL